MRPWNIEEQVVEDPTTKMRLEFSSVHTDEVSAGREAPLHDKLVKLRMWTTDRSRVATFCFTRDGMFVMAQVEPIWQALPGADMPVAVKAEECPSEPPPVQEPAPGFDPAAQFGTDGDGW